MNDYAKYEPYLAYTELTDEKKALDRYITQAYHEGSFPLKPGESNKFILDVGSGNGIHSLFLAKLLPEHTIEAIERSAAQLEYAQKHRSAPNINYHLSSLEDWPANKRYDFILVSHVLQYIDTDISYFVNKVLSLLKVGGEAWFIQQTKTGMAQIIAYQQPLLIHPRFKRWRTFEDYQVEIENMLKDNLRYSWTTDHLATSFAMIDFKNPSLGDKLRLQFIFCLYEPYDHQTDEFKQRLIRLQDELNNKGRIIHPNGIMKIKRLV